MSMQKPILSPRSFYLFHRNASIFVPHQLVLLSRWHHYSTIWLEDNCCIIKPIIPSLTKQQRDLGISFGKIHRARSKKFGFVHKQNLNMKPSNKSWRGTGVLGSREVRCSAEAVRFKFQFVTDLKFVLINYCS